MKTNLRDILPRSFNVARSLRRLVLGGALAVAGGLGFIATTPTPAALGPAVDAVIVNREKKAPKLVLQLPASDSTLVAQHRSHSSHQSHSSHSSHRSHFSSSF